MFPPTVPVLKFSHDPFTARPALKSRAQEKLAAPVGMTMLDFLPSLLSVLDERKHKMPSNKTF